MNQTNAKRLRWLACYWFASVCFVGLTGGFNDGHPDVAFSDSVVVTAMIAPLAPPIVVVGSVFSVFSPKAWPNMVRSLFQFCWAFGLPFLASTLIALKWPGWIYSHFGRNK